LRVNQYVKERFVFVPAGWINTLWDFIFISRSATWSRTPTFLILLF